jgi:hypothetical protein
VFAAPQGTKEVAMPTGVVFFSMLYILSEMYRKVATIFGKMKHMDTRTLLF